MLKAIKLAAMVLVALAVFCGQPVKAQNVETFVIPPMDSNEANNATYNIDDVIITLRQGGFKSQAAKLQELLDDGRLYYQWTGEPSDDNSAHTSHADSTSDGKERIRFGRYHVSDEAESFGRYDEPKRYSGYMGDVARYMTVKTALHEFVHTTQPLSLFQESNRASIFGKFKMHEVEAYRRSLKQFADGILVDGLRDYLISKDGLSPNSQAHALQQIRAMTHAFEQNLYNPNKELGPVGAAGDKACRWKAIDKKLVALFFNLKALEYDARSHDECGQDSRNFTTQEKDVVALLNRVNEAKSILDDDLSELARNLRKAHREHGRLQTELSNPNTIQTKRMEIARRTGDLNRYLSMTRPRHDRLKQKSIAAAQRQKSLNRQLQSARNRKTNANSGYQQCRVNYITLALQQGKINKSQIPPDMGLTKKGNATLLPPSRRRVIDLEQEAAVIESMFNYDPDELARASDPRTPCYPLGPTPVKAKKPPAKLKNTPPKQVKPVAKTKKVCSGGGLLGKMNCVTIRIEEGN